MAAEDWITDFDYDYGRDEDGGVSCRYCGAMQLSWEHDGTRWYLVNEDDTEHNCRLVSTKDDFKAL